MVSETERDTERVLERMENSLNSMEQMSFDAINITDRLVVLTSEVREHAMVIRRSKSDDEKNRAFDAVQKNLEQILETAFSVNNVSHELEQETVYQRNTTESLRQIIDFLYAMQ